MLYFFLLTGSKLSGAFRILSKKIIDQLTAESLIEVFNKIKLIILHWAVNNDRFIESKASELDLD